MKQNNRFLKVIQKNFSEEGLGMQDMILYFNNKIIYNIRMSCKTSRAKQCDAAAASIRLKETIRSESVGSSKNERCGSCSRIYCLAALRNIFNSSSFFALPICFAILVVSFSYHTT